jgi:uncharacterized protein YciI
VPYFCVYGVDRQGVAELRAHLRPEHRERLRCHDEPVSVRIGGPLTDATGKMIGTMLVVEAEHRSQVEIYMEGDPYVRANLFDTLIISGFNWGLGQPSATDG